MMNRAAPSLVEAEVDTFGYLYSDVEDAITGSAEPGRPEVYWETGASGQRPNIFRHNLLRDFVCDDTALRILRGISGADLQAVALLRLGELPLTVVRADPVLDVVDEGRSIPSEYSWARIGFPHIRQELWGEVGRRIFHLPYPELSTTVVVGAEVRDAYRSAGLTGWSLEPALVDPDAY
ncbi:hypothetical protein OOK36_34195 [Streptomyces sp. NBC_00365]|uniref:hypothetical protein n=1 Tax=Streptomyces sp. NBC_00365 TaxID=2975726 RepID=UPI00224EF076|nr:hypothetical protein [Streptomyces sp. NBC_00365]MCX5093848.1 hypothetical protein [Streptomyces sp. NBC_00365]